MITKKGSLMRICKFGFIALGLVFGGLAPAVAEPSADFYAGKSIDLVIGYPPAGSNDVYARTLGRYLGKHIPGHPAIVPKNIPGGGSFLALAYLSNAAPKDGTAIGIGAPTAPLDEKLGSAGVRFKAGEFNWLGRIDSLVNIVFMWHSSPVKTLADAQRTEATLAATGAGSTVAIYPTVTNNVLGTKFKLIMGYKGSAEAQLAVERGEAEGHSTAWTAVKVAHPDWLAEHKINILVQYALKPHPELLDVPVVVDLARNDRERAILRTVMNATEVGTAFMTTPGVPAERVAMLRHAFDDTMKDPGFPCRGRAPEAHGQSARWRAIAEAGRRGQQPAAESGRDGALHLQRKIKLKDAVVARVQMTKRPPWNHQGGIISPPQCAATLLLVSDGKRVGGLACRPAVRGWGGRLGGLWSRHARYQVICVVGAVRSIASSPVNSSCAMLPRWTATCVLGADCGRNKQDA
jgi:hypothetical protein